MFIAAAFVLLVFAYSLVSRRLERTVLTAPIVFTLGGALLALLPAAALELQLDRKALLLIAELGLVMTLFTDASRISMRMLGGDHNLPVRLLGTGMLLSLLLGALGALVLLTDLSVWEAGIIACILAPTDAGLGQVIVSSPKVPQRIRQALNVEAGLNDGLSVPFLLFFIALATAGQQAGGGAGLLTSLLVEQLGHGTLIGLAVGLAGGWLLGLARRAGWMAEPLAQLGVFALPLACVLASEASGASMFIAAFVAGIAAQFGFRGVGRHAVKFTEDWGQLFNLFVFFLFGLLAAHAWQKFTPAVIVYALLSLTLVRMLPVAMALRGTGLSRPTISFMGWFGPRGLASIVLGLVTVEHAADLPGQSTIWLALVATVLLSILAHGLSALPGIRLYERALAHLPQDAPEFHAVPAGAEHAPLPGDR
jgi:NhaP-type Na+/H+ or K+/H+ antiporter